MVIEFWNRDSLRVNWGAYEDGLIITAAAPNLYLLAPLQVVETFISLRLTESWFALETS